MVPGTSAVPDDALPETSGWTERLDAILDARLLAHPQVIDFRRCERMDKILRSSTASAGSIARRVRLRERILQVVTCANCYSAHLQLRRELRHHGIRALIVPEGRLLRRPDIEVAELIAASALYPVLPLERILLAEFLADQGGSSVLGDCAALMRASKDPVSAVLALAASKAISIDVSRPIGPLTRVDLAPAR